MYKQQRPIFYYAVSPVHMGAGTAVGAVDNPIQREVHTDHPLLAGSGLKGALRQRLAQSWENQDRLKAIFGPETQYASEHAGALSLSDAQLVAFPVRSLKNGFAYVTSPTALGRARRLVTVSGQREAFPIPDPGEAQAYAAGKGLLDQDTLVLETYAYTAEKNDETRLVAEWLANNALPADEAHEFFRNKLKTDLVIVPDEEFSHFVMQSTIVEPHVRIDDTTGTADGGGLFYTENLPPESLMIGLLLASDSRRNGVQDGANAIVSDLAEDLDGKLIQVGGNATTGRGQIVARLMGST